MQNEEYPDGQTIKRRAVNRMVFDERSLWRSNKLRRGRIWGGYAYSIVADMVHIMSSAALDLGSGVGGRKSD